jgi:Rrf2 family protein
VASTRGASGGYQLSLPPEDISLADIMIAIDGPDSLPSKHKPETSPRSPATQAICSVWNEVLATEKTALQEVTLADLVKRMEQPVENMYYI